MNIRKIEARRRTFEGYAFTKIDRALRIQYSQAIDLLTSDLNEQVVDAISEYPMEQAYQTIYQHVGRAFGRMTYKELVNRKQDPDPDIREFMDRYYRNSLLSRIRNVTDYTKETLRDILSNGINEGLSLDDMVREIRKRLPQIIKTRAQTIAATEVVGASNAGSLAGADATGFDYKKIWMAVGDSATRATHLDADGQTVGKYEPFIVGGIVLRFPGDAIGTPDEVINCRCTVGYTFD